MFVDIESNIGLFLKNHTYVGEVEIINLKNKTIQTNQGIFDFKNIIAVNYLGEETTET